MKMQLSRINIWEIYDLHPTDAFFEIVEIMHSCHSG